LVRILLAHGADVGAPDEFGQTPLHAAAKSGHMDLAELLIAHGGDVGKPDKSGETPLHAAAWSGRTDLAELLISRGAEVNAKDHRGETPLDEAKRALKVHKRDADKRMIDLLKKHGAK
jgi:ankyrin repeat protein